MFYVSSLEILNIRKCFYRVENDIYPYFCPSSVIATYFLRAPASVHLSIIVIINYCGWKKPQAFKFTIIPDLLLAQTEYVQCFYPAGHLFMFRWRQTEWRIFWKWWHPMEMSENSLWKQGKWMCTHMYRHIRTCACTCTHTHTHTLTYSISLSSHFISAAFSFSLTFSICLSLSPPLFDDPVWLMTLCDWWPCVIGDPVIDDPVW